MLVELELAPGARKSFEVTVGNEGKEKSIELIAFIADLKQRKDGQYELRPRGESEFSCADWMTLADTSFTLGPGASKLIEVQLKVPRNVSGGRYGAVVFEVVPEPPPPGEKLGSVRYHFRMPTFVEVTIKRFGGKVTRASISDMKVEPVVDKSILKEIGEDALAFSASLENRGNIHIKGTGTLIMKTEDGKVKRKVPLGGGRGIVLPGSTVDFMSFVRKPVPGEYIARALIDLGGMAPATAEIPFSVTRTKSSTLGSFKASSYIALDIKPENVEMKIPQRGLRAVTLSFRNDETDTIEIKADVQDIEYNEEGNLVLLDSSETGRSCREWITLEPQEFAIAPQRRNRVKLTFQAPSVGGGGYYACLVFDASLKSSKEGAISTPFQIPVIMSIPPDLDGKGEIVDVKLEAGAGSPVAARALFKNTGNVHVKPKGRIVLKLVKEIKSRDDLIIVGGPEYEEVGDFYFEEVEQWILPGGVRIMQAGSQQALKAGRYLADVTIDYGGSAPAKFRKEFTIK
jgi:hypothetical protein